MADDGAEVQDPESQFRRVYDESFKSVYSYIGARVPNRADTPDLVAEVFATAWRRMDQVPAGAESRAWLVGVARRVLSHHYRAEARRGRLLDRIAAEPKATAGDSAAALRLDSAFGRLGPRDRELLRMMTWDELSNEEAAQVLGCSTNALAIRLHRARRRLARQLEQTRTTTPAGATGEGADSLLPEQKGPR